MLVLRSASILGDPLTDYTQRTLIVNPCGSFSRQPGLNVWLAGYETVAGHRNARTVVMDRGSVGVPLVSGSCSARLAGVGQDQRPWQDESLRLTGHGV